MLRQKSCNQEAKSRKAMLRQTGGEVTKSDGKAEILLSGGEVTKSDVLKRENLTALDCWQRDLDLCFATAGGGGGAQIDR